MFRGSFSGNEKGPFLFWEKEWGSITAGKYCQRIVPLIDGTLYMRPWLSMMQDNAPHAAARTMEEMGERVITPISWPPNSPDLNPMENLWHIIKKKVQELMPTKERDLIDASKRAWESISKDECEKLVESMVQKMMPQNINYFKF